MATEGPAVRRVPVAEHPRWGRGDARALGSLGLVRCRGSRGIRILQEQKESLGCYKVTWLGLQEDRAAKSVQPYSLPRSVCLASSMQILLSLVEGWDVFCWTLAENPKLILNLFSLCFACQCFLKSPF